MMVGMKDHIRLARPEDAPAMLAIYAPFCGESPVSFEIAPPTLAEMTQRIVQITSVYPWLVCERDGRLRGYVYASRHAERAAYRWGADVTAYMHADSRRQGLARALYTALFDILRGQGFFTAYAGITLPNPASVGLHRALGFTLAGVYHDVGFKAGSWRDVSWWELRLQSPMPNPPEPVPVMDFAGTPAFADALAKGERLLVR
jgi:L-amino acid N-acyltransferase YncA